MVDMSFPVLLEVEMRRNHYLDWDVTSVSLYVTELSQIERVNGSTKFVSLDLNGNGDWR
jgi:hypothetical protein